jgi:predicted nucleic acid-binding protein
VTLFYLDASALCKRYAPETGTDLVNRLFSEATKDRMLALHIGLGEVMSVIVRRHNGGLIPHEGYAQALTDFRAEVVDAGDLRLEPITAVLIHSSLELIARHSLNATDALVLRSALDTADGLRAAGDDLVLVSSDARLTRAAAAAGLLHFNPELDSAQQLDALIAA